MYLLCVLYNCEDPEHIRFYPLTSCLGGKDLSTYEKDATLTSITYRSGPQDDANAAAQFSAEQQSSIRVESSPELDVQYELTIMLHLIVEAEGSIINFGQEQGVGLNVISTGEDSFDILFIPRERGGTVGIKNAQSSIIPRQWVFVAAVYKYQTGTGELYLDGRKSGSFKLDNKAVLHTNEDIYIGSVVDGDDFTGSIACLRIYDAAWSTNDIKAANTCPFGK